MESMLKTSQRTYTPMPSEDKQLALPYFLDAWEEAAHEGVDRDCIATAASFAALSDLISTYGEEPVAVMCQRLPERIRGGEFTFRVSDVRHIARSAALTLSPHAHNQVGREGKRQ